MAQNIIIAGASYNNVPSIQIPRAEGGVALFEDTISSKEAISSAIEEKGVEVPSGTELEDFANLISQIEGKPKLEVFAEAGSMVTISCGNIQKQGIVIGDSIIFNDLDYGIWTIIASLDGNILTDEIEIVQYSISLENKKWLYREGDMKEYTWSVSNKPMTSNSGSASPSITPEESQLKISLTNNGNYGTYKSGMCWISTKIDLTDYKTIYIQYDKTLSAYLNVWTNHSTYSHQNKAAYKQLSNGTNITASLNVSSLNGLHLIGFSVETGQGTNTLYVKNLWLEK